MMAVVAEMMIAANSAVAERLVDSYPGASLLRRHPPPRMEAFQEVPPPTRPPPIPHSHTHSCATNALTGIDKVTVTPSQLQHLPPLDQPSPPPFPPLPHSCTSKCFVSGSL